MAYMLPDSTKIMLNVVLLGDAGVGKSSLMERFVHNRYQDVNYPTVGVDFMKKDIELDSEEYTLRIWDIAGLPRYRELRTPFYQRSNITMLCYAVNDRSSFRALEQWREEFLKQCEVTGDSFSFIAVGTKNDAAAVEDKVNINEVQEWCEAHDIQNFIETSSKNTSNVCEAFFTAVRHWRHLERLAEEQMPHEDDDDDSAVLPQSVSGRNSRFGYSGGGPMIADFSSAVERNYDFQADAYVSSDEETSDSQRQLTKRSRL